MSKKTLLRIYPSTQAKDSEGRSNYTPDDIKELSRLLKSGEMPPIHLMYEHSKKFSSESIGKIYSLYYNELDNWMWGKAIVDNEQKVSEILKGDLTGISFCYEMNRFDKNDKRVLETSFTKDPDFEGARVIMAHNKNSNQQLILPLKNKPITKLQSIKNLIFSHSTSNLETSRIIMQNSNNNNSNPVAQPQMNTSNTSDSNGGNSNIPSSTMENIPGVFKSKNGGYISTNADYLQQARQAAIQQGINPLTVNPVDIDRVGIDAFDTKNMSVVEQNRIFQALLSGREQSLNEAKKQNAAFRKQQALVVKQQQELEKQKYEQRKQTILPHAQQVLSQFSDMKMTKQQQEQFESELADKMLTPENAWSTKLSKTMLEKANHQQQEIAQLKKQNAAYKKAFNQHRAIKESGLNVSPSQQQKQQQPSTYGEFTDTQGNFNILMTHSKTNNNNNNNNNQPIDDGLSLFDKMFKETTEATFFGTNNSSTSSSSSSTLNNNNNQIIEHSRGQKRERSFGNDILQDIQSVYKKPTTSHDRKFIVMAHSKAMRKKAESVAKKDNSHLGNHDVRKQMLRQNIIGIAQQMKSNGPPDIFEKSMFTENPKFAGDLLQACYVTPTKVTTNKTAGILGFQDLKDKPHLRNSNNPMHSNVFWETYGCSVEDFGRKKNSGI